MAGRITTVLNLLVEPLTLFSLSACSIFIQLFAGFGSGLFFQIGFWWLAAFGVIRAPTLPKAVLLGVAGFFPVGLININWTIIKNQPRFTLTMWSFQAFGTFLGAWMLETLGNLACERALGFVCLGIWIFETYQLYKSSSAINDVKRDRESRQSSANDAFSLESKVGTALFVIANMIGGVLEGMFALGEMPLAAFRSFFNVTQEQFAAATMFSMTFGNAPIVFVYLGMVSDEANSGTWVLLLFVAAGCFVGLGFGMMFDGVQSDVQENARAILRFWLLLGSCVVIAKGFGYQSVYKLVSWVCGIILILGLCVSSIGDSCGEETGAGSSLPDTSPVEIMEDLEIKRELFVSDDGVFMSVPYLA